MNLNQYMHPNNIYRNQPDFRMLAVKYPVFREHATQDLSGKVTVDFKNPTALRALTQTLLKEDFGLDVFIPPARLIPTLPQRLNYLLWVNDLLATDSLRTQDGWGLDIGTGATCIFPLLGHKQFGWKFVAIDCDSDAVVHAKDNVERNGLETKIQVFTILENTDNLHVATKAHEDKRLNFCVCNPPFFSSEEEANSTAKAFQQQRSPPKAANDASTTEAVTDGGEVSFVRKIIMDSLVMRDKIRIYTVMLGKKSSLAALVQELKKHDIDNISTTELCQGYTMRWGLAWTFIESIQLVEAFTVKRKKKRNCSVDIFIPDSSDDDPVSNFMELQKKIVNHLRSIQIEVDQLNSSQVFQYSLKAKNNTWIHQRRQRREALRQQGKLGVESCITNGQLKMEGKRPLEESEIIGTPPLKLVRKDESSNDNDGSQRASATFHSNQASSINVGECLYHQENGMERPHFVSDSNSSSSDSYALLCHMSLRRHLTGVTMQLTCTGGHLGLNGFQQLVQFLRNSYRSMLSS